MSQYPAPYDPYEPQPPARNTGKTVGGVAFGVIAALMLLGELGRVFTGSLNFFSGARGFGQLVGVLIVVGIPALISWWLLSSHGREVKAWQAQVEEERRQRRLTGGGF